MPGDEDVRQIKHGPHFTQYTKGRYNMNTKIMG
jgi:hypothetical protein